MCAIIKEAIIGRRVDMEFIKSLFALISNVENWSVDDVLSATSIVLERVGGLFAYRQWKSANSTRRT